MFKKFTLVESLVVLSIIGILFSTVAGTFRSCNSTQQSFIGTVVRKYEMTHGEFCYKYVDVRINGSSEVQVFENEDDWLSGKNNSLHVQANLIEGKTYMFQTRGNRYEVISLYPNIIFATPVD
jgi:prepilin-type N-terminal cleavage/methylation domain-containing protein